VRIGHRSFLWLAGLALVATGCSSSDQPAICSSLANPAVVNGKVITCDDLYRLRPEYSENTATADAEQVRGDLTRLIQSEVLITSAAADFGLEIADADIEARLSNPPERWAGLLGQLRPEGELRLDAITSLVRDGVMADLLIEEYGSIEAFAAQRPQDVVQVCARVIVLESEAAGIDAINRLDAGEDFLDLQRELSIDQSSDGLLTLDGECPVSLATLGEEFALAAALTPLDEPAGPIPLGGFHGVIRVEERVGPDGSTDLTVELLDLMDAGAQSVVFSPWASDALREADVEVSSVIGRWSPDAFAIAPPGFDPQRG
jgi:hypothetical protein